SRASSPFPLGGGQRPAQRQELRGRDPEARELRQVRLGPIEGRNDDPVDLLVEDLSDAPHRKTEEFGARLAREDADRLEAQLLQGDVRELGGLADAVEDDALRAGAREVTEGLAERLTRPPVDTERVRHVVVREAGLLQEALRSHHVAETLARRGLAGELGDLDQALRGQTLEIEVRQAERHPEALRERALGERPPLADGGENLEVSLLVALHGAVQRSTFEHEGAPRVKLFDGPSAGACAEDFERPIQPIDTEV